MDIIFENVLKRTWIDSSTYRDQGHLAGNPEVQRIGLPPWSSIGELVSIADDGPRPVSRFKLHLSGYMAGWKEEGWNREQQLRPFIGMGLFLFKKISEECLQWQKIFN